MWILYHQRSRFVDVGNDVYLLLVNTDGRHNALREDMEADARDFEVPTWSLTVDQQYLKTFSKDVSKRQDVIHGRWCGFM